MIKDEPSGKWGESEHNTGKGLPSFSGPLPLQPDPDLPGCSCTEHGARIGRDATWGRRRHSQWRPEVVPELGHGHFSRGLSATCPQLRYVLPLVFPDASVIFVVIFFFCFYFFFFPLSESNFFFAPTMPMDSEQRRGGDSKSHWM